MNEILDSGNRREFDSGAVRDIVEGKGRCDLMPLSQIGDVFSSASDNNMDQQYTYIIRSISSFVETGYVQGLHHAILSFSLHVYDDLSTAMLEVAKHYEQGCNKYGERNWEKGIPLHCYIDSGVRHLLKYIRGDKDEPHDRAFIWNMLGALWTVENKPELVDLPFANK